MEKEITASYCYDDGKFEINCRDGSIKHITLEESLVLSYLLGNMLCNNPAIVRSNIKQELKQAFHSRDSEILRRAIKEHRKPKYVEYGESVESGIILGVR